MSSNNSFGWEPCLPFQGVNVLGKSAQEEALLVQKLQEIVSWCWFVSPWKELLQSVSGFIAGDGKGDRDLFKLVLIDFSCSASRLYLETWKSTSVQLQN